MKWSVLVLSFAIVSLQAVTSHGQSTKLRPVYVDSLNQVVKILKEDNVPGVELIDYCIPETQYESLLFFQLDYKQESSSEFRKLLQQVDKLCLKGREPTIKKFIVLSQFVDGYFAEDYFDSAEKICKAKRKVFCKVFNTVDTEKKQKLISYGINCKNR